ncbi:MAG TPA: MoaD/ThiS family protein [Thermodesulfobacteriota bacterium]|nr:MoaD/ThiS family protein [Thermodesulfobacteriota bacterium]
MIVEVKIFASLRRYIPYSDERVEGDKWDVVERTTVGQLLEMLNLPEEEANLLLVNGRRADRGRILQQGDVLHVFPPMCGG